MFMGDLVDYESDVDVVAITVRTPLATIAYEIADHSLRLGKKVLLGGPHIFAYPEEAIQHATAVAIGEGEDLWPQILSDIQRNDLKQFYVCGPFAIQNLPGTVHHVKQRPTLEKLPLMRRDLLPRALHDGFHFHHARLPQPLPLLPGHRYFRRQDSAPAD
jgi:radical SAM superfamily enzyme YgiQ (UPF0313 family)